MEALAAGQACLVEKAAHLDFRQALRLIAEREKESGLSMWTHTFVSPAQSGRFASWCER